MAFASNKLLEDGDMAATITTDSVSLAEKTQYALHAVFTGSPVGTLTVETSIDGTTYDTLADSSTAVSAAGSQMFNIIAAGYLWARLKYTRTSGTGTLNVFASVKE